MKRIAVVEKERCNPDGCGGYLCIKKSPLNRMGVEAIVKGTDGKAQINEDLATDALQVVVNVCPFHAIHMVKLPDHLTTRPIHRYGKDQFILYSLPTPAFDKVVGIIGVNGIGKSTAIKILASSIKPNLGDPDRTDIEIDELIKLFKGTEMQTFLEKFKKEEIIVSYKPQEVELIQKNAKGKVRALLDKVNETKKLKEIIEILELNNILENDINKISGGEMQRVAIAATVLKKANLYIFDEPSSFLDIKQRLKIARFIRDLADEETSVLVIEHDLIVMDYMADLVNIMYGKEKVYGIVSQLKPVKTGMNAYLEGYLKDDNVRFRDHKIEFDVRSADKEKKKDVRFEWPAMEKKLGNFQLKANAGTIKNQEVIGILGPNGIGKTTFMKLLAGAEEPDSGKLDTTASISYKPQNLASDSEELVMNVLSDAIKYHTNDIIDPLNLKDLFTRQLKQLSGGELQRVAVAEALGKKADIILLDEPSAYLDTEQRLNISKIIRNVADTTGKAVLVVDHDLVFLDYIANRLIVFQGEPAVEGTQIGPVTMEEGMNLLLKEVEITLRRDDQSGRPRINKLDSVMDRKQKDSGKYYYN